MDKKLLKAEGLVIIRLFKANLPQPKRARVSRIGQTGLFERSPMRPKDTKLGRLDRYARVYRNTTKEVYDRAAGSQNKILQVLSNKFGLRPYTSKYSKNAMISEAQGKPNKLKNMREYLASKGFRSESWQKDRNPTVLMHSRNDKTQVGTHGKEVWVHTGVAGKPYPNAGTESVVRRQAARNFRRRYLKSKGR